MDPLGCDKFGADLSAFLDGELSAERAREVEQHLALCEDCRHTLAQLRDVAEHLAGLPRLTAPSELAAGIRKQAERRLPSREAIRSRRPRTLRLVSRLSAVAAMVAVFAFLSWRVLEQWPAKRARQAAPEVVGTLGGPAARDEVLALKVSPRAGEKEVTGEKGTQSLVAAAPADPSLVKAEPEAVGKPAAVAGGPGYDALSFAAPAPSAGEPPVSVVITPHTDEQYAAAWSVVETWQRTYTPNEAQPEQREVGAAHPATALRRQFEVETPAVAKLATFQVDAARAWEMIQLLEQQAPAQVRLDVPVDQLQQMIGVERATLGFGVVGPPESTSAAGAGQEGPSPAARHLGVGVRARKAGEPMQRRGAAEADEAPKAGLPTVPPDRGSDQNLPKRPVESLGGRVGFVPARTGSQPAEPGSPVAPRLDAAQALQPGRQVTMRVTLLPPSPPPSSQPTTRSTE